MAGAGASARAVAAEIVDAVVTGGQSLDAAIARFETRVIPGDRPLLRMLSYGTLRNYWQLGDWVDTLLDRPLKRRDAVIGALLATGLFQLADTRVPDHAAVSQTVEAARQLKRPRLAGLLNACMRRFQREPLARAAPGNREAHWNHPNWLIDQLERDWPDDWQDVLAANDERAPMWLRVNGSRTSVPEYLSRLSGCDISAHTLDGLPDALCLAEPCDVGELPGFADGDVSVQDGAAQLAARWLLTDSGARRVLDACAAPGGKSAHLLEYGQGSVELTAVDSDAGRLCDVRENLTRLGLDATIIAADASKTREWWNGESYDAILLDAPCSATGVIRRHPDIKLLRRAGDIDALSRTQRDLLDALWPLLAPGGRLLYATCSTLAAENDDVVRAFLEAHESAAESTVLPNNNIRDLMRRKVCGYQVLPGMAGLDGFYYACLEKKTS